MFQAPQAGHLPCHLGLSFPQLVQNISSIFTIFPQYLHVFAEWLFLVAAIPDTPALGVSNVGTFSSIFELVDVLSDKTG